MRAKLKNTRGGGGVRGRKIAVVPFTGRASGAGCRQRFAGSLDLLWPAHASNPEKPRCLHRFLFGARKKRGVCVVVVVGGGGGALVRFPGRNYFGHHASI
jgi:hypothetical protein